MSVPPVTSKTMAWLESFEGEERGKMRSAALDLFKTCTNDYAQNFLSLRGVEWTVSYQLYAGLALISAAYMQVPKELRIWLWPSLSFIALATVLLVGWLFLSWQIQRRLHWTRNMQNVYLNEMHDGLLGVPRPDSPAPPKFHRWYAFTTQAAIAVALYASVCVFIWLLR